VTENLPTQSRQRTSDIDKFVPEHSLDYFIGKRGTNKRDYIFRYKKARSCDHPRLDIIARGGNQYHCPDCNYTFQIGGVFVQPEHFNVIMSMFTIMRFVRLYGTDSLQEVWRRPIGQTDGTPHKPVLPEGMSVDDVFAALDEVDSDASPEEMAALRDFLWVGPKERKKQLRDQQRQSVQLQEVASKDEAKRINRLQEGERATEDEEVPEVPAAEAGVAEVSSMSQQQH
jgi:hypothetical protein